MPGDFARFPPSDDWGPLTFMRKLLCIGKDLKPTCGDRVRFDMWSTHPYTSGGPAHHAVKPADVSLADLPEMRAVLNAAIRAHHIVSARRPQFWVTEFSWDSRPPDPHGVPTKLLKRQVPQTLYAMWRSGVSVVTWFSLCDESPTPSPYQSGLFYAAGPRKPTYAASASRSWRSGEREGSMSGAIRRRACRVA